MSEPLYFFLDDNQTVKMYDNIDGSVTAVVYTHYNFEGSLEVSEEPYFFDNADQAFDFFKSNEKEVYLPSDLTEEIPF